MSDIYINYNGKTGFTRVASKDELAGKTISYEEFKKLSADIESGTDITYGITMSSGDVQDFIENYEDHSLFAAAEKG